jgi:hypothetical protein
MCGRIDNTGHGAPGDDFSRDAAEHDLVKSGAAMSRHDDQVAVLLSSLCDDHIVRCSRLDHFCHLHFADDIGEVFSDKLVQPFLLLRYKRAGRIERIIFSKPVTVFADYVINNPPNPVRGRSPTRNEPATVIAGKDPSAPESS